MQDRILPPLQIDIITIKSDYWYIHRIRLIGYVALYTGNNQNECDYIIIILVIKLLINYNSFMIETAIYMYTIDLDNITIARVIN